MVIGLAFQVPAARRAAVRRALDTASTRRERLQALYVDTADGALARARLALMLRREGVRWVQALERRGDGVAAKYEHEVTLVRAPRHVDASAIDPARHAASEAGRRLERALRGAGPLAEMFRTDVQRLSRRVARDGALIEIAFDEGMLRAASGCARLCELEFELLSGPAAALPALAARWMRRHCLWWDVRSQAERGRRLAQGLERVPPLKAARSSLAADIDSGTAFARMLQEALAHALPNLAEIADGLAGPEHLHQLRVALRRARSVLRECGRWCGDPAEARALDLAWRAPFAQLGAWRERDVVMELLAPRLAAAGLRLSDESGPHRARQAASAVAPARRRSRSADPASVVCSVEVQQLLMRTLALALGGAARSAAPVEPATRDAALAPAAARLLRRVRRRTLAGLDGFADAARAAQHRVRKRLKRLRYLYEFLLPLYHGRRARRMRRRLATADAALGTLGDLAIATSACEENSARDARFGEVLVRLADERAAAQRQAERRLRALANAKRPWRRPSRSVKT